MPSNEHWWERWWNRFFKFESVFSLFGGASVMGALLTYVSSLWESAPTLTSVGWLLIFLGFTAAVVFLIGLAGWARQHWLTPASPSQPTVHYGVASAIEPTERPSVRPVALIISGNWSGQPLRQTRKQNGEGIATFGEDLVLEFHANQLLSGCKTRITIRDVRSTVVAQYEPQALSGDLASGTVEEVLIGSVHFYRGHASITGGPLVDHGETIGFRRNLSVVAFEGTDAESIVPLNSAYDVSVRLTAVNLAEPVAESFSWEVREVDVPLARVRPTSEGVLIDNRARRSTV